MDKRRIKFMLTLLVSLVMSLTLLTGCEEETPIPAPDPITMHSSRLIGERFLGRSPTFIFDGIRGSIEIGDIDRCVPSNTCFTFHFSFRSTHPGYGDRGGEVLADVITVHEARITVEQELVTRGVIDEKWDIMAQRFLPGKGP